jgi:hypothetical protein
MNDPPRASRDEGYNPWSIVNLVFGHLAEQGLHPILGESGDPGVPAAELLVALGIEPVAEGIRQGSGDAAQHYAALREAILGQAGHD